MKILSAYSVTKRMTVGLAYDEKIENWRRRYDTSRSV